jgi:hypothetical protein
MISKIDHVPAIFGGYAGPELHKVRRHYNSQTLAKLVSASITMIENSNLSQKFKNYHFYKPIPRFTAKFCKTQKNHRPCAGQGKLFIMHRPRDHKIL